MGVNLVEISTVVIGRFNPQIIAPPWLAKEGIISGEGEIEIKLTGRAVAFQFKTGEFTWQVDYNRLSITTDKPKNTAALATKVVEKLPHTPLTAFGNNFRYQCSQPQWKGRLPKLDGIGMEQLKAFGDVQSVGWSASIGQAEGVTINVQVTLEPTESLSPTMVTVNLNYHRQVSDAAAFISASQEFESDRRASASFLEKLLGDKVEQ
jgi:hypothetical protein